MLFVLFSTDRNIVAMPSHTRTIAAYIRTCKTQQILAAETHNTHRSTYRLCTTNALDYCRLCRVSARKTDQLLCVVNIYYASSSSLSTNDRVFHCGSIGRENFRFDFISLPSSTSVSQSQYCFCIVFGCRRIVVVSAAAGSFVVCGYLLDTD